MKTNTEKTLNKLKTQTVHFNRGKYTELLNNSQLQSPIHERFRMFSLLRTTSKMLLWGAILGVTSLVATTLYITQQETESAQKNTLHIIKKNMQTALKQSYEYEATMQFSTPKNYPYHLQLSHYSPHVETSQLLVAELEPKHFRKLGLELNNQGRLMYPYKDFKGNIKCRYIADTISWNATPQDIEHYKSISVPNFYPHIITDTLGVCRYVHYTASAVDKELAINIANEDPKSERKGKLLWEMKQKADAKYGNPQNMIAILIKTNRKLKSTDKDSWLPDVLLWYEASPELLELLPKDLKLRPLGKLKQTESNKTETLRTFFDTRTPAERSYDSTFAIYNVMVYPNPVTNKTCTIRYNLHQPQTVSISLCNISGDIIQVLSQPTLQQEVVNEQQVQLPSISPGVYVIKVSNSAGVIRAEQILVQ